MTLLPVNNGFYIRNYRSSNLIDRLERLGLSNANNIISALALLVYKSNQNALNKKTVTPLINEYSSILYNSSQSVSNNFNSDTPISILDIIKKNDLEQTDLFTSVDPAFNSINRETDSISSSASIYDLLQVLTESSTSGLTQVLGALNISIGAPIERVTFNLDRRLPINGCVERVLNDYLELDGTQETLDSFVVGRLGYSPLSIESVVNSISSLPKWLEKNEPTFRPLTENLLIGNLSEFLIETLYYQTGFNLDVYQEELIEFKHLVCSTFGLAVTSTAPCIPLEPIQRPIPNVLIVNAVSQRARVEIESIETGVRINAISLPASADIIIETTVPTGITINAVSTSSAQTEINLVVPVLFTVNAVSNSRASVEAYFSNLTNYIEVNAESRRASVNGEVYAANLYAGQDDYWLPNLFKAAGYGQESQPLDFQITDATSDTSLFYWQIVYPSTMPLDLQGSPYAFIRDNTVIHPYIGFSRSYNLDKIILRLSHLMTDLIYDEVEIFTRIKDTPIINDYIEPQEIIDPEFTVQGPLQHWRLPPSNQDSLEIIQHNFFSWKPPENTFHLDRYEVQAYKTGVGWETIASTTETKAEPGSQEYVLSTENYEIIVDELEQAGFLIETSAWSSSRLLRILTRYDITWAFGKSQVFRLAQNNRGIVLTSNLHFGDTSLNRSSASPAVPIFYNKFTELDSILESLSSHSYFESYKTSTVVSSEYIFYLEATDINTDLESIIVYNTDFISTGSLVYIAEPAIFYVEGIST